MDQSQNKNRWLHVRLSEADYKLLRDNFSKTTELKLSVYARKILLDKPLIGTYRNLTADALMVEFAKLIKDLNGVANNFNQAVRVLHTLKQDKQYSKWLTRYQEDKNLVLQDIRIIRDFINKTAGIWLQ